MRIRRENDKFGEGIHAIWGVLKDGEEKVELQAIRFDAAKFTEQEARAWLKDHDHKPIQFEKASEAKAAFLLSLQTGPGIAVQGVRIENGLPVHRYKKELIRIGRYIKASDGISFEVTDKTLDHWVATFSHWTKAGNKVPIPLTHRDPTNPEQNQGWVVDMFREGNSLFAVVDLVGKDAGKLALTSDVSIYVPPEFTDGHGNVYRRPITHVALCTDPIIPGLKGFESVAASLQSTKENDMDWTKIKEALGIAEDMTDANAEELILKALAELKKITEDKLKVGEQKVEEIQASHKIKTPDPLLVKLASENRDMKLRSLVASARITPAVKDKLAKRFVESAALALSLSKGDDGFDDLVSILAENDPVKLKEQTGPQVLSLAGGPGQTTPNPVTADIDRRRKQAGLTN